MRGVRFGALGFFCVVAGAIAGCGVDAPLFSEVAGGSGEGGEAGDVGQAGEGSGTGGTRGGSAGHAGDGEDAGATGVAGAAEGGANGHAAGEGGEGNTSSARGGSGGSGRGGSSGNAGGGAGGSSGGGTGGVDYPDRLDVCGGLTNTADLSYNVTLAYEEAMGEECSVNWTFTLYFDRAENRNDRADFLNRLLHWNLRLWGCQSALPQDFPLIYQGNGIERVLTRGDARALIDVYAGVADDMLGLSAADVSDLRGILTRLSEPALFSDSDEFSNSTCSPGSGGAAGSGGQAGSSGSAGQGGMAGSAGAGGVAGAAGVAGAGEFGGAGGESGAIGG